MYLFTWPSPWMNGELGSPHGIELRFVFGTLNNPAKIEYTGKGRNAERLSEKVMDAWIAFARTGNPNHEGIPEWFAYSDKRETMLFDKEVKVENAPFETERKAWDFYKYT